MIRAVLILAGAAGRAMRDRGRGTIINVSSTAGFLTMGSYSATKAYVTVYTESLANELAGTGVHGDRPAAGLGPDRVSPARLDPDRALFRPFCGWMPTTWSLPV